MARPTRQGSAERAKTIRALCRIAKRPDLSRELIAGGATIDDVRTRLIMVMAEGDAIEIDAQSAADREIGPPVVPEAPPEDPETVFREQQRRQLREHLAPVLSGEDLERAMLAIALAMRDAIAVVGQEGRLRELNRDASKHYAAIATHATALRELLDQHRPTLFLSSKIWPPFLRDLDHVIASTSTHIEAACGSESASRGRKPLVWRDRLISVIFHAYPPGEARRSAGSHFETTVDFVLRMLGEPISDVHSLVVDALARHPDPPFHVL